MAQYKQQLKKFAYCTKHTNMFPPPAVLWTPGAVLGEKGCRGRIRKNYSTAAARGGLMLYNKKTKYLDTI
jgi:hypothetical protein